MGMEPVAHIQPVSRRSENIPALGYMLLASVANSVIPLIVDLSGGSGTPFLFNAWLRAGVAVGCLLFLVSRLRSSGLQRKSIALVGKRVFFWPANKPIVWALIGSLDYACFAWAIRFMDVSVAAVLFEMYPAGIMFVMAWLFRQEGRYRRVTVVTIALIALSMAGLVFASASQITDFGSLNSVFLWDSVVGVGLVALAIVAASLSVYGLRWGADLSGELSQVPGGKSADLYCVVIALFVVSLVSVFVNLVTGLAVGESMSSMAVLTAFGGGVCANAVASIVWRKSTLETTVVGINAIGFGVPVLSLLWLHWIANVEVARWDFLIIGTTAIVVANLLINFEAEVRLGSRRSVCVMLAQRR